MIDVNSLNFNCEKYLDNFTFDGNLVLPPQPLEIKYAKMYIYIYIYI